MARPFSLVGLLGFLVLLLSASPPASAQNTDDVGQTNEVVQTNDLGQVRVAVRGDSAFVYHTARLPYGYGFHVERSVDGGEFERLTEAPVRALVDPALLPDRLGPLYDAIREDLRADDPSSVFFRLRADPTMGLFLSMAYPSVARAMGRLYVDRAAPIGQSVTYRVLLTDDLGAPITPSIERDVESLSVVEAPPPTDLQLDNQGTLVRLDWTYPRPSDDRGDQVLRFEILEIDSTSTRRILVSPDETLLRNEAQTDFFYVFSVPAMGRTATYVVAAVQGTGRRIESEPMTFFIEDNVPPAVVGNVEVFMTPTEEVEISWPVSPELDLAGYRLTRAQSLTDPFEPLTDSLLAPLQTVYTDSTTQGRRTYYYKVVAVDSSDNESNPSNPVMARVKDEAPPPTPDTLRAAIQDDGTVRLSWTALPSRDLYTYEAFYQRGGVGADKAWARATDGVLLDTTVAAQGIEGRGFADGARYRFGVAAVDSSLNRSDTTFVSLKIPDNAPPDAPPTLLVQNDGGVRALLRWTASGANDVTEYILYRRLAIAGVPDSVSAPSDTAFTRTDARRFLVRDDSAQAGQEYVYAVTAVDSLGNESPRTATRFTMRDLDPPPAVRNVQAVVQDAGGALVIWETPPGADVAGYRLYRSPLPTGQFTPVTDDVLSDLRFTDPNGTEDTYYRVYALDTSGNVSDPSRPARAVQPRP